MPLSYQITCVSVEWLKQVFCEHSTNFPVFYCPNLFKMCCLHQVQTKHIVYIQKSMKLTKEKMKCIVLFLVECVSKRTQASHFVLCFTQCSNFIYIGLYIAGLVKNTLETHKKKKKRRTKCSCKHSFAESIKLQKVHCQIVM